MDRLGRVFSMGAFPRLFLLLTLLPLGAIGCAGGGSGGGGSGFEDPSVVTLGWTGPGQNADGTPLTDLAGYRIHEGTVSGVYTSVTDVGNTTEFTFDPLPEGTYYFAVTAYDSYDNESEYSEEVSATVQSGA